MVLDALIAFFSLLGTVVVNLLSLVLDLFVSLVELVLSAFGRKIERTTFRERRAERREQIATVTAAGDGRSAPQREVLTLAPIPRWEKILAICAVAIAVFALPALRIINHRTIRVEATDGHVLPFAVFIVERGSSREEVKSTVGGKLEIPRRMDRLVLADRRYQDQVWEIDEIGARLTVERSLYGKSLDFLLEKTLGEK